jgi:DHA2 family multidrug resistance protein-like MFS transporter
MALKATRREWIGLAVIALPCVLYSMDLTVLDLAIPKLVQILHPNNAELLWILDIYGFLVAGALLPMGALGDRIGRRRLLLTGAAAFGITSVIAAFASSPSSLIAARATQGLAGAPLAPSTLSLIRNMFHDKKERAFAISLWLASYSTGAALGPIIGGIVLAHFQAGAVFLLAVPVMLLLLVLGPRLLPEFRAETRSPVDWKSASLSLAAVLLVIYGVKRSAAEGFAFLYAGAIALGLVIGAVFVRRQVRLERPLVDIRLFRVPAFRTALLTYCFATFASFGTFVIAVQFLQLVRGLTALQAGIATLPFSGSFVIGSMATTRLGRRYRPITLIAAGLAVGALGFAIVARADLASLVIGMTVYSLGLAPVFTLATDVLVGSVAPERSGAAAALSETASELGGALGIAVLGSVGAAVFRNEMHSDAIGDALVTSPVAAKIALTDGLEATAIVAASITFALLGVALLSARYTRAECAPVPACSS